MTEHKNSSAWTVGDRRDVGKRPAGEVVPLCGPYKVGLASWIIQDGNYGDFESSQHAQFALEYYAQELTLLEPHAEKKKSLRHIVDDQYRAIGKVIHRKPEWNVIDFGILAYQSVNIDARFNVGDWVRGDVTLGVDHFSYFERLSRETNAPALIYKWVIDEIEVLTAPFVQLESGLMVRDKAKWGWRSISKTNAWKDDDKAAEYLFTCTLRETAPTHKLEK